MSIRSETSFCKGRDHVWSPMTSASDSTQGFRQRAEELLRSIVLQLDAFDLELESQIRQALTDGITTGVFRAGLDLAATAVLLRHAVNGVSELVAATPERAADIVANTLPTILAAITTQPTSEDPT